MTGIKIWIFFTKIEIFRKIYPNLVFPKILTKIDIFDNFDQNRGQNWDYLKILTSIEIFNFCVFTKFEITSENADKNRNFRKFWPPIWNLSKTMSGIKIWIFLTKIEIFRKIYPELSFSENVDQNWRFRQFWTKFFAQIIFFFVNIDQIKIFENWSKHGICSKFWLKYRFSKNLSKADYFRKFSS